MCTHPTADQVYEMVRRRLPRVSLATVYRNLETLSDCGIIQKLEMSGTQRRYDGNPATHYHTRCLVCGRVADISVEPCRLLEVPCIDSNGFHIRGHRLEFIGVCRDCREAEGSTDRTEAGPPCIS